MRKIILFVRATLFWVGFAGSCVLWAIMSPVFLLVPFRKRYFLVEAFSFFNLWWLKMTCGIHIHVKGQENIPENEAVVFISNHQSTWETLAFASILTPFTWVLKRELMWIPFFGLTVWTYVQPIAIDRSSGKGALKYIRTQGRDRLRKGIGIVIFPEGTRVKIGESAPYKKGGFMLAAHAQKNIIPIAHNSGECWPKHSYFKYPGTVTVSIGPLIKTEDMSVNEMKQAVNQWIEEERKRLPSAV